MFRNNLMFPVHRVHVVQADDSSSCLRNVAAIDSHWDWRLHLRSQIYYLPGLRHALVVELVPVRVHLRHLSLLLLDQLQADRGRQALRLVDFITVQTLINWYLLWTKEYHYRPVPTVDAPRFEVDEEVIVAPTVEGPLSAVYHTRWLVPQQVPRRQHHLQSPEWDGSLLLDATVIHNIPRSAKIFIENLC